MANQWFRFYGGEYLGDPKMDAFDGNERSCWLTILCLASQSRGGWILYTSEEKLLEKSGIPTAERVIYSGILKKYEKFSMVEYCNGDVTQGFRPKNWEKRQYSEGYLRLKKHRENKRNENVTQMITPHVSEQNRTDVRKTIKDVELFLKTHKKERGERYFMGMKVVDVKGIEKCVPPDRKPVWMTYLEAKKMKPEEVKNYLIKHLWKKIERGDIFIIL